MINAGKLRDYVGRSLGASGSDFNDFVISSINDVSRDIRSRLGITVTTDSSEGPANITHDSENIILDDKYLSVYKRGITFYMGLAGEWGREPDENAERYYMVALADVQKQNIMDQDNRGFRR